MKRIDLHIHTNNSDGILSPLEVIDEAIKNGVDIISITDHDSIESYDDNLYNYAKEKNIRIITGVEISTKIAKAGIHVLGYNIDINNEELINKLKLLRNARHDYLYNVGNKLKELGYIVNLDKLNEIDAVTKAHIAEDIITDEKNRDLLLKVFNHIPGKGEFIELIMNEERPAYVRKETITPKEAATLIRKAHGQVVLAHPVAYQYEDGLTEEDILSLIKDMEADGIEANYIYISRNNEVINDIDKWNIFARNNNLFSTIGSDFHNKNGISPEIGLVNYNFELDKKGKEDILNHLN